MRRRPGATATGSTKEPYKKGSDVAPKKLVLIPVGAAAVRVGWSDRTIRRYIQLGKLRAYRVGDRTIRVDQADVDALVRPIPAG